jgi:uracil-DNA glycosylase family 4
MRADRLGDLVADIATCRRCPRLVAWREEVARRRVARHREAVYWGRPVPGFGDPAARILLVGLAPAAHGGNRTGRVFTGDNPGGSGELLFEALHGAGLAARSRSVSAGDGLLLQGAYIAAAVRCAPPGNRPSVEERDACLPYLARELALLPDVRVILALGAFAWDGVLRVLAGAGHPSRPRPRFGHAARVSVGPYTLLGCYHPSQQNTFTGRLTAAMLGDVLAMARTSAGA